MQKDEGKESTNAKQSTTLREAQGKDDGDTETKKENAHARHVSQDDADDDEEDEE